MIKRFLTLAATAALLTGCYHTATTTTPPTNTAPTTQQPPTSQVTEEQPEEAMAENSVEIKNFAFNPKEVTVKPGAKITFTNQDIAGHSFTSDDGKSFDTGVLAQGKSATVTAPTTPGSYPFHCTPHPNIKGTLIVK